MGKFAIRGAYMDKVRAFDIPVDDMERAGRFYMNVFDWEIFPVPGSGGNFHAANTAPVDENGDVEIPGAINGGFFKRGTHGLDSVFLEIEVESIEECFKKVLSMGGQIAREKSRILDIAFFAVVKDPEGNFLGLWENLKR